ncbi:MAG: TIGR03067 domain-containing protein [Gemmataceae bacterium]|nr:TIGR03067 domain-containing protein [Gemmataceae bacterium]
MDVRLDPSQKPKWIDLTFKKGEKSYPLKAIYDLSGDELRLCIPLAQPGVAFENKRPDGFETKDKPLALLRLKRAKP